MIERGNALSRNPNVCASCSSLADGIDEALISELADEELPKPLVPELVPRPVVSEDAFLDEPFTLHRVASPSNSGPGATS